MTNDEKAKAYDEALKDMMVIYPNLKGDAKLAVEHAFPQLRESEDERIRKWLVDYFSSIKETVWIHRDITCGQILAWLEKQKENPKNAISIPADCASNAKCEDRWHKVTDSLPDNPREVLCKDEARNYFIGRYYVGEGWEISNYDDEDKPHHLNPPVSKWIDFPSEKQKEPKPAEWSEEEKDMVAFIVAMCDDGLKDCVKGSTAYRVYNEIKDWINNLRPQSKTKWSEEDEKQLDDIISIIRGAYEHGIIISETRHRNAYSWLNNLRPSWKPSEEQMEVLLNAEGLVRANNYNENAKILASLYEQLKKL